MILFCALLTGSLKLLETYIELNYNVDRGEKCHASGKDILFMLLAVVKYGGNWDILGRVFKIKGPKFERMIPKFVSIMSDHVYKLLVVRTSSDFVMQLLRETHQNFKNIREALYATNVTFQQSFRPSGAIQGGKIYFSGRHKLYGVNVKLSVLQNGLAVGCISHHSGSVGDKSFTKICWKRKRTIEIYSMLVCYMLDLNMNGPYSPKKATRYFKKFVVQLYRLSDHRMVFYKFQTKPGDQATQLLSKINLGGCIHYEHYFLLSSGGV